MGTELHLCLNIPCDTLALDFNHDPVGNGNRDIGVTLLIEHFEKAVHISFVVNLDTNCIIVFIVKGS